MTVQDKLDEIIAQSDYLTDSLELKRWEDFHVIYQYISIVDELTNEGVVKTLHICTDENDDPALPMEDRTIISFSILTSENYLGDFLSNNYI